MASKLIIGFVLAVFFSCLSVQGQNNTCRVAPSITKRAGSDYVEGGRNHSVFDITITNVGSCTVQSINISINVSGVIEQYWNLRGSPINEIVGFGGYLAPGQVFTGAGLIASNNGVVSASIRVTGVSCRSCDINSTSSTSATTSSSSNATTGSTNSTTGSTTRAGTTSSSSNATTGSTTTGSATTGSTNSTTGSSTTGGYTGCPASVSTTLRQSYTSGSTINYVFDISVTNLSPTVLNTVGITYGIENRTITQTWNLVKTCCTQISSAVSYNVSTYNLQPGSTFSGAGFIQTLTSGTNYTAPVAQVFNPATGRICGF